MHKVKDKIALIKEVNHQFVYTYLNQSKTFNTLNQALKEYHFDKDSQLTCALLKTNNNAKCKKCKVQKCLKHYSKILIDRTYINLDENFDDIDAFIDKTTLKNNMKHYSKINYMYVYLGVLVVLNLLIAGTYLYLYF